MGRCKNTPIHTGKYKMLLYHNDKGRILRLLLSEIDRSLHPTLFRMIVYFGSGKSNQVSSNIAKQLNSNTSTVINLDKQIHMCLVDSFAGVVGGKSAPSSDNSH